MLKFLLKTRRNKNVAVMQDLDRAADVLRWNKYLMSTLGLWPEQRGNLLFMVNFGYFSLLMVLEYLDLFFFINNLEHVVMNLTENLSFSQILVKLCMLRFYKKQIGEIIDGAIKDFNANNYKTTEEKVAFIAYNARSKTFVKLLIAFVALTASSYYFTPILVQIESGLPETEVNENESQTLYTLPYRFHVFYSVENMQTYVLIYAIELPFLFISGLGQSAADCIMVTLVFHICGQMSVLAVRINDMNPDPNKCQKEMRSVIRRHIKLLRLGKMIEEAFSVTLLAHLVGATTLICILGYQILTNIANGEMTVLATFLMYQISIILILYTQCAVGECLLIESEKVRKAFYNCKWHDMPVGTARNVVLCMTRARKPLCLSAGKFNIFCHSTLTEVLKTSMGYLSVLRTFL